MTYNDLKEIIPQFNFEGRYIRVYELTSGNVNNTYRLEYALGNIRIYYTLQRINAYVFNNPEAVVGNIAKVTEHIRKKIIEEKGDDRRSVLSLIKTKQGEYIFRDKRGDYWRAYRFIDNADALDVVNTAEQMEEVGRGFGRFQRLLTDYDATQLYTTIPNFHNSTKRFYRFVKALDEDRANRAGEIEDEIEFIFDHRKMMGEIVKLLDDGVIPYRVTHNDTKANNVLLDGETGKALCVIDLDTVMPGSVLFDYGDAIRYGASLAKEDEEDISKIRLDMDKVKAFTKGFIDETNGFLLREELLRLPLGVKVITCELAMRFLTDYIDGDLYFKVNSPEHNLIRARAQIALLKDIERRESALNSMIQGFIR